MWKKLVEFYNGAHFSKVSETPCSTGKLVVFEHRSKAVLAHYRRTRKGMVLVGFAAL